MDDINFKDRVAIVTGSGGGLGRTYAMEIARRGGSVVVNDLGGAFDGEGASSSMADSVVEEIRAAGGTAVANYDSVASRSGGEAIVNAATTNFGRLDIVINNAGHLRNAPFEDVDDDSLDSIIAVHLKGAFYVTQPAFRIMKKQRYGRVVFASSNVAALGNPEQSAYGAAKAGLIGIMNNLSLEGADYGVLCNALLPVSRTRMMAAMSSEQVERSTAKLAALAPLIGNSFEPHFVTPLAVYLASESCQSTHAIYSSVLGRYARVVLGFTDGWIGPREVPPSVEDIASHWSEIQSAKSFVEPGSMEGEFEAIFARMAKT